MGIITFLSISLLDNTTKKDFYKILLDGWVVKNKFIRLDVS